MICAGIDAGSRSIKVVLWDDGSARVLARRVGNQGVNQRRLAEELWDRALSDAGIQRSEVSRVVATGYGRKTVDFADTTVTEITCHARGVHQLAPDARTVVEIGGQDSKVILLENGGRVRDFAMNDRCAAGTGRFLEMVAARLEVDLPTLAELSRASTTPVNISSTCVVFAESEIIGLLAEGKSPRDIAAGVQAAIATRIMTLAGCASPGPVYFTGGVALQSGMVRALEHALAGKVRVPPHPQFTGALGAALLASAPDHTTAL